MTLSGVANCILNNEYGITLKTVINLNPAIQCSVHPILNATDICRIRNWCALVIRYWREREKCARMKMTCAVVDIHDQINEFWGAQIFTECSDLIFVIFEFYLTTVE